MKNDKDNGVQRRIMQVLVTLLVQIVILFWFAGTIQWIWAWVVLGIGFLVLAVNFKLLPRELIAERGHPRDNVKKWDKIISLLTTIPVLLIYVISGLDHRFGWSGTSALWFHLLGVLLMLAGHAVFSWAMISNRFFSTVVRIQDDRNQSVASAGPYKIVRHPGYMGFILQTISTPLILGSTWGLIPAGVLCVLFLIRTACEDTTLRMELDGYREYADEVRYKLIPGVW